MKKLEIGQISVNELADWFGITPNSLSKQKSAKLEELKYFANYHIDDKNHVIIDEVINDTYEKAYGKNYKKILDKIDDVWNPKGLDTAKRVGEEIYEQLTGENQDNLALATVVNYTLKGRNELYGKPFISEGKLGSCNYIWCKKDKETGELSLLSEEERIVKENLQKKYFGDTTEKQILVKGMIEAGEIREEEAWGVLENLTNMKTGNFMGFLRELQEKIGCQIIRGTMVERRMQFLEECGDCLMDEHCD